MKKKILLTLLTLLAQRGIAQVEYSYSNKQFLQQLNEDSTYYTKRDSIGKAFESVLPGAWGQFVKGVSTNLATTEKVVALTFDACGGKHANGYDAELIAYLLQEQVPATLFVTGRWIDANYETFLELSKQALFEIENHGLNHSPASINGRSAYGIKGTATVSDIFDEIEANELKIAAITGRRPLFYRSATAFTDEASASLAQSLDVSIVNFSVISGDAVPNASVEAITWSIMSKVKPGSIVIMHFNHPEWNGSEALKKVIPKLRKRGYSFVLLKDYPLKGK